MLEEKGETFCVDFKYGPQHMFTAQNQLCRSLGCKEKALDGRREEREG